MLLTGATGFIGRHIALRWSHDPKVELVILGRNIESDYTIRPALSVSRNLEEVDKELWINLGIDKFEVVVHLAAHAPKFGGQANLIRENVESNIIGTYRLLESLPSVPRKIVYTSTLDVYALAAGLNEINELSPAVPASLYGASKLYCESLVSHFSAIQGCDCALLRLGHVYGPGEESYSKLIPNIIRSLLQGKSPSLQGSGKPLRDFIYVDDVVEAINRAVLHKTVSLGPINVVSGKSISICEIATTIANLLEYQSNFVFPGSNSPESSLVFNNKKMFESLGSWRLTPLTEGLKSEIEYFKESMF